MNPKVAKRRDFLIDLVYVMAIIGLVYVFFKYCFVIAAPFLLSFFFAVILQRPLGWLDKKTKNKMHSFWSIVLVLLCVAIILGPVISIIATLFREIGNFISFLGEQLNDLPTFLVTLQNEILKAIKFLPDSIYTSVSENITQFFGNLINDFDVSKLGINMSSITSGLSNGISGVYSVVKNIPSILIGVVIGVIAWILFTKDYKKVVKFIKLQLPDKHKNLLSETKKIFSSTILKMCRAYGLIMFITFCENFLGLTILNLIGVMKNSYVFVIAICIAVFDILPVAGSGGILIPWSLIALVSGNVGQCVGLLILYAVITVIRQYIEPKIVGDSLGVNPLVTLAGLYFGLKLFGFMGMFIVPICVMTLKAFNDAGRIHLYTPPERN
ncbi:MAG TPA: sporulation integral membrane protein YtvI [Oscillospiraceae bacterium]|jgi:sporulation integral membrane protein YtvI|nr:sporulation integral membrane protein YtvI [Oscillospiraceae bacterium]